MKDATQKLNKGQLIDAINAIAPEEYSPSYLAKTKKADLIILLNHLEDQQLTSESAPEEDTTEEASEDEFEAVTGSRVKEQWRAKYREDAIAAGHKATTSKGRASLNNGDPLAILSEMLNAKQVCCLFDALDVEQGDAMHTWNLYKTPSETRAKPLNDGMCRMNAGNKIRGMIKRGEIQWEEVESTANGILNDALVNDEA